MAEVGFSTGCLWKMGISTRRCISIYQKLGASAIEIYLATPKLLDEFRLDKRSIDKLKSFDFISLHGPSREMIFRSDNNTKKILNKLEDACYLTSAKSIVVHPEIIEDYDILEKSGLPFVIENMDTRRDYGKQPEHFAELMDNYNFGFVLDIAYIHELDSTMELGKKFISYWGNRLHHMHVSGFADYDIHAPVTLSNNKKDITKMLELNIDVPKILEGVFIEDIMNDTSKELAYVKKYEKDYKSKII